MFGSVPASVAIPVGIVLVVLPFSVAAVTRVGARWVGDSGADRLFVAVFSGFALWLLGVVTVVELRPASIAQWNPVLGLLSWAVPIAVILFGLHRSVRMQAALATRFALAGLAALMTCRIVGAVFLILHGRGELAGLFAYPAAYGDILVGVTAPIAAWAAWSRFDEVLTAGSVWRAVFVGWNVVGLADMFMAVTLGLTNLPGMFRLFHGEMDTSIMAQLPMTLFPAFLVSTATALHFVMLAAVRRSPVPNNAPA